MIPEIKQFTKIRITESSSYFTSFNLETDDALIAEVELNDDVTIIITTENKLTKSDIYNRLFLLQNLPQFQRSNLISLIENVDMRLCDLENTGINVIIKDEDYATTLIITNLLN